MSESVSWPIEPIRKQHLRDEFDCGSAELNDFLKKFARQNEDLDLGRTFVATQGEDLRVWGYYTLRSGEVAFKDISVQETQRFPRYPTPVVHLGRLAADLKIQGQGLGSLLLVDSLRRSF